MIASATGFMSAADIICHFGGLQATSQVSEQIYPKLCEKLGRGPRNTSNVLSECSAVLCSLLAGAPPVGRQTFGMAGEVK